MAVPFSAEEFYLRVRDLVADMPRDLATAAITPKMNAWVGRAIALVEMEGVIAEIAAIKVAAQNLTSVTQLQNAQTITSIVYSMLARAELRAPPAAQGSFIPVGRPLDALMVIGRVLAEAKTDVLMIDPYADTKVLSDFAPQAPERVPIRVLADGFRPQPNLKPAAEAWVRQYGPVRPLEVRLSVPRAIHDRLILIDRKTAWTLGQSFKDLAARAPTSVAKSDPELSALKVTAYTDLWKAATPI